MLGDYRDERKYFAGSKTQKDVFISLTETSITHPIFYLLKKVSLILTREVRYEILNDETIKLKIEEVVNLN
jgi:hypothetical protein